MLLRKALSGAEYIKKRRSIVSHDGCLMRLIKPSAKRHFILHLQLSGFSCRGSISTHLLFSLPRLSHAAIKTPFHPPLAKSERRVPSDPEVDRVCCETFQSARSQRNAPRLWGCRSPSRTCDPPKVDECPPAFAFCPSFWCRDLKIFLLPSNNLSNPFFFFHHYQLFQYYCSCSCNASSTQYHCICIFSS